MSVHPPESGAVIGRLVASTVVPFRPRFGRPSMGTTDASGKYELVYSRDAKGAKIGKNLVTISTAVADASYEAGGTEAVASKDKEPAADPIPAKYNSMAMENPDMTVEVKAGANTFDWDVKSGE